MATRTDTSGEEIPPLPTRHALMRWDQRTPADSVCPEAAWLDAWQLTITDPEYRHFDELRYHHPSRVVLCRENAEIVTVYAVDGRDARRIVRQAILNQFDVQI